MPTREPVLQALPQLREDIENLALHLALWDESSRGPAEAAIGILKGVSGTARSLGAGTVAAAAADLIDSLEGGSAQMPDWRERLRRLQQVCEPVPATPANPASLGQDPELVSDFILESREHLANIESHLLALEHDPDNAEAINSVFRGFHTIKGLAGFLDLAAIQSFTHDVETLLDMARSGRLKADSTLIDLALHSADHVSRCLEHVESALNGRQAVEPPEPRELCRRIAQLLKAPSTEDGGWPAPPAEFSQKPSHPDLQKPELPKPDAPKTRTGREGSLSEESKLVKVDTAKVDHLVDMVGELVIAQSLVRHDPSFAAIKSPRLARNLAQLARLTGEVQKTAMAMRMVPIGQTFHRMVRLVRDLTRKSGKIAELELAGEETELDRNMVEELADPLMHMVRNAVDHGVELPGARKAAGKAECARLQLRAYHQGSHIVIEICDDGRGLDRGKILEKARQRGLAAAGDHLSDAEVFGFIFEPGFSTAERVSDVSGRGVGMDVVRRHIQKLRGRIDIQSTPGAGVRFTIKLPLTLAIIDGFVVGVGKERYIVPIFAVREIFRPQPGCVSTVQQRGEMALVRGSLLPVVRLHRRFGVPPRSEDPCESLLVVAETASNRYCLMVDELQGKQEVVIKSLGESLKNVAGVAGGAILGDGRVGLILDLEAIFGAPASGDLP
ncbi:MAG: chemotaxis protein CheA [Bryobacteraceae bacterium]